MEALGVWLRQAREALGLTLEEVESATRIRPRFIEALEAGDFAAFPGGEVQVRGFLRIYARFLDLDPNLALARYDIEVRGSEPAEEPETAPLPAATQRPPSRPPARVSPPVPTFGPPRWTGLSRVLWIGAVIVVLTAVLAAGRWYWLSRGDGAVSPTASSSSTTPSAGFGMFPTATPLGTPSTATLTPVSSSDLQDGVTLTLEASEHTWVRVTRDGDLAFQGTLPPGRSETWSGQNVIVVETGNGAGLEVTVNGQAQGPMCERGQVCTRAWGPDGEVNVPGQ
jgi:transcriptional regulator with XRE-family HTH domain